MTLNRRHFLRTAAVASAASLGASRTWGAGHGKPKVVIVGGGNVGLTVAKELEAQPKRMRARVIEKNRARAENAADALERTIVLHGDGMDTALQAEANIDRADAILAVTDDDKTNLLASVRAKAAGCPMAICLVNDPSLVPLMAAGFAFLLLRQVLTGRMATALVIGAIGALWVIFRADLSALLAFDVGRGEAIYFLGCVSHAIYTPMVRRLNRGESAVTFTFGTAIAGGVLLSVYAAPAIAATAWAELPPRVWFTLFYVAFFATAITVVLLQFATLRLPSAKVMAYTYLGYRTGDKAPMAYIELVGREMPEPEEEFEEVED